MRSLKSLLVVIGIIVCVTPTALAEYPLPTGPGETLNTYNGLKLWPYEAPYADHVGRFVDSAFTVDLLYPPPRTLRAKEASVVPANNRVYMQMGEHFVGYNLSTFFTSKLGSPLSANITAAHGGVAEKYLPWDGDVYPENTGSGWSTYVLDGQQRLFDYDWDDRGYTYPAYYIWGFGIVQDSTFKTVRQVDWKETSANPQEISSFKANGKYYVIVGGEETEVWDVTQPTSPFKVRDLTFGLEKSAVAHLNTGDVLGLVVTRYDNDLGRTVTSFDVYRASDLVLGGSPVQSIVAGSGNVIADVDTDETNFYVLEKPTTGRSFTLHTMRLSNASVPSYSRNEYAMSGLAAEGVRYGSEHLTLWGSDDTRSYDIWLFRLENNVPVRRELGEFIKNHYTDITPPAGYTTPAVQGYTANIYNALYTKYGGKEYLIVSAKGLGDVYELESPDRLSISLDGLAGTPNPNSPTTGTGMYYGDPIQFSSSYGAGDLTVNWNFGNPEYPAQNTRTTSANTSLTHQYAGLTTAAQINTIKTASVADVSNASNNASTGVTLKVPTARVKLAGTSHLFPETNISSVGVVRGDSFVDASDGTYQSHYVDWNLDGSTTTTSSSYALSIGTCGTHVLTQTARYAPYTGTATSVTPLVDAAYVSSVGPLTFDVKPFIPVIEVSSDSTNVTFSNKTRFKSGTFVTGAQWNVQWQLVNGGSIIDSKTATTTAGSVDTFTVAKSAIQAGYQVKLGIAVEAAALADQSCAATGYLSAETSFTLEPPDPTVKVVGCTEAGGLCELTMSSASAKSISDWNISWYLNNTLTATGPTFKPNFPAAGTYQVKATVSNDFGAAEYANAFTVTAPACSGSPTAVSINFHGVNTNCTGTSCTSSSETFEFSPYAWGYEFQECDTFSWNFGDGSTSTNKIVQHKYAKDGQYKVTLVVKNINGQTGASVTLTLGTSTPPPPPPPGCPTTAPPSGQVFAEITGPCSTLSPDCPTGEAISFRGTTYPYRPQECDSFRWNFGDGTSATGMNATHTYSQPGNYTATFTVTNSKGSSSGSIAITVGGGPDPCPNAPVVVGIAYSGPTSGCTATNSTGCLPNEPIKFVPETWGYQWQECDSFLWEFGDGATSTQREPTHQYTTGGDMTVKVTVTNEKGTGTAEKTFLVGTPATPPTSANFTYTPGHPKPGEAVTFTASTSGGDPATSWNWSFGDGGTGTGETVTHTFINEGKFNVGLEAKNSGGSAQMVKEVSVTDTLTYLLPVVTHGAGSNDSSWRTDLQVFQPSFEETGAIEVVLDFKGIQKTMFFDSSTEIFVDVLGEITDLDDAGPVFLHTPVPLDMWTRTYNVASSGVGTFGQLIPAILLGDTGAGAIADQTFWNISGLKNSTPGTGFRTNLGFVNPTAQRADVTVHIYDEEWGLEIGTFDVSVDGYQLRQQPMRAWFSSIPVDEGFSLRIQSRNGVELISYASIIDNISNDPIYVGAVQDAIAAKPEGKVLIVPGVGHVGSWRSDLTMFNPDSQAASLHLEFFDETGTKLGEAKGVVLPSKGSRNVKDLLRSEIMNVETDTLGTLKITTTSEQTALFPVVFDRTYNDQQALGTFGQGIPAFPRAAPNVEFDKPAFIPGVRNDSAYRTNIGLVSLSDTLGSTVTVHLLHPNTGRPTYSNTIFLGPNQSKIIPRAISDFLHSPSASGTLMIEIQEGGPVWAYGSVIDNLTEDPEYVPAVQAAPGTSSLLETEPNE